MKTFWGVLLFGAINLLPMMLAAALVLGVVVAAQNGVHLPWFVVAVASPVIYVAWLMSYLCFSGWTCGRVGRKYPKPRYQVYGDNRPPGDAMALLTAGMCYNRLCIIDSLPLAWTIAKISCFRTLVYRAYSPSVHIGDKSVIWGHIIDPDLTYVNEGVVIGAAAVLSAHADSLRPNGDHVYVSAPIQIGRRVTIGGGSRVSLGCVVGDDAVIESGAVLPPFTVVPEGEVWAGNPACCQRKRQDRCEAPLAPAATVITSEIAGLVERAL